jgi:hypothetical protein
VVDGGEPEASRCLLAAVDRDDAARSLVGLSWAMDPSDRSRRSPDCHSSCMSAAGLGPAPIGGLVQGRHEP